MQQSRPAFPTSALLSFTVENVRSCRDEVHLSLLATRLTDDGVVRELRTRSPRATIKVLPGAALLGANASGKSNLLFALGDMQSIVMGSFRFGTRSSGVPRRAFMLDRISMARPSRFEVDLILGGVRWQYGFEVDDERVLHEYAYHYPKGRQAKVFQRTAHEISIGTPLRSSRRLLTQMLKDRGNALLLSAAGATANEQLSPLFEWFHSGLRLVRPANRAMRVVRTAELVQDLHTKDRVMALIRAADLGICGIERVTPDPEVLKRIHRAMRVLAGEEGDPDTTDDELEIGFADSVRLTHRGKLDLKLDPEDESQGTMAWVGLMGAVLDALDGGHVLLVDELDTSLHPHLVSLLIKMFQDTELNPRCAQLVFNAHDVSVLGGFEPPVLGRDQIWLVEKDHEGATTIYSLADFRPRRDEALERRYMQGRYGAVPVVDSSEVRVGLDLAE